MKRFATFAILIAACISATFAQADEVKIEMTLSAGDIDRVNAPVVALIDVSADSKTATVMIDGKKVQAQLAAPGLGVDAKDGQKEIHFLLPALAAGETKDVVATVSTKPWTGYQLKWVDTPGKHRELQCAGCHRKSDTDRAFVRYMYEPLDNERREETYKVFHHVFDLKGENQLITKGAGGRYTHHRGIFYGFSRTTYDGDKKCDIWHCRGAHQAHREFLAEEAGTVFGRHTVGIDWMGEAGSETKPFADESRQLAVYPVRYGSTPGIYVDFVSQLMPTEGPVKVDGDPQHAGFHFRAAQSVCDGDQKKTYYLRTTGKGEPGQTLNWPGNKEMADLPWNAMSPEIDGTRYTICYLDNPNNPKEARFSERTYGRFGSYFVAEATKEKPLVVKYRLWIQEGDMTGEQAQALSDSFLNPVKVEVK